MSYILRNEQLEKFMKKHKLDCTSIIIKIDHELRKAYYVIDGSIIIKSDYKTMIDFINS
jgi:hypothetical protein